MMPPMQEDNVESNQDIIAVDDKVKACSDCAHVIGVRYKVEDAETKWRCGHEKNTISWKTNPVTGLKYREFKVVPIMDARVGHCKSDWWELYVAPVHVGEPTIGGQIASDITLDPATLAANRDAATKRVEEIKARKLNKLSGKDLENL